DGPPIIPSHMCLRVRHSPKSASSGLSCRNNPVAGIMTKIMETRAPRIARAAEADFTGQFDKGRAHRRLARPATTFRKEEAGTVGIAAETITARSVALQSTFCC